MPALSSARLGRRPDRALQDLWRQRFLRFERSGLSALAFCAKEGVSTPSFYAWRRRLSHPPAEPVVRPALPPADAARLVPVHVLSGAAPVEILLPGGIVLRLAPGCDPDFVRELVEALGGRSC